MESGGFYYARVGGGREEAKNREIQGCQGGKSTEGGRKGLALVCAGGKSQKGGETGASGSDWGKTLGKGCARFVGKGQNSEAISLNNKGGRSPLERRGQI